MAKVKPYQMSALDRGMLFSRLCLAMTLLASVEEAKEFLIDLLTPSESLMLARRIKIAELLLMGMSYSEIREELGVGIGTISNVQQWLEAGSGRFRTVLKQIFKEEKSKVEGNHVVLKRMIRIDGITLNQNIRPLIGRLICLMKLSRLCKSIIVKQ